LVICPLIAVAADYKVHIVYMGGNDCPPCRAWRATELPKLEKTEAFKRAQFTHVEKLIKSSVPPAFFLPAEVRPYKDQLDEASSGMIGSPQTAILVDGKVYDYYWGTRTAPEVERMLNSIYDGKPYPFERCVKRESQTKCAKKA
jgi:hypothetical protein